MVTNSQSRKTNLGNVLFGGVFILFWTLCTLTFDVIIGFGIVQQYQSLSYEETLGFVISSKVESKHDSEHGTKYYPKVHYGYTVGESEFESDRISYSGVSSGQADAKRFVSTHPVGKELPVFYSVSNPQDSVLTIGLQGSDLFMLLFITPFNVLMVGGWVLGYKAVFPPKIRPGSPGFRVIRTGQCDRIAVARMSPLLAVGVALLVSSFLSIFVVGFGFGFNVSLPAVFVVWTMIGLVVLATLILVFVRNASGKYDLALDHFRNELQLPISCGRKRLRTVPLDQVRCAELVRDLSGGVQGAASPTFKVKLRSEALPKSKQTVLNSVAEPRGEQFVHWLNENWFRAN